MRNQAKTQLIWTSVPNVPEVHGRYFCHVSTITPVFPTYLRSMGGIFVTFQQSHPSYQCTKGPWRYFFTFHSLSSIIQIFHISIFFLTNHWTKLKVLFGWSWTFYMTFVSLRNSTFLQCVNYIFWLARILIFILFRNHALLWWECSLYDVV